MEREMHQPDSVQQNQAARNYRIKKSLLFLALCGGLVGLDSCKRADEEIKAEKKEAAPSTASARLSDGAYGPPSGSGSWTVSMEDDFGSLNTSRWHKEWPCGDNKKNCWFNGRFESVYPSANTNVDAANGNLQLITKRETITNWDGKVYNYSSGVLTTAPQFDSNGNQNGGFQQLYGYFEARIKSGSTAGNDPDFWLAYFGGWPPEIDIAEFHGSAAGTHVGHILHYYDSSKPNNDGSIGGGTNASAIGISNFNSAFHTYGLLWEPDKLVYYIDGQERFRITQNVPQVPMYIVLSDEIRTDGGAWFGNPANGTYPQTTLVDWVKVYRKSSGIQANAIYEMTPQCYNCGSKRLDVAGGTGPNVQIYTSNNLSPQRWKAINVGTDVWEFEPLSVGGKRLDAANGVTIATANSGNSQRWKAKVIDAANGIYELEPLSAAGNNLDVATGPDGNKGPDVQIYSDNNSAAQRWKLVKK